MSAYQTFSLDGLEAFEQVWAVDAEYSAAAGR